MLKFIHSQTAYEELHLHISFDWTVL